MTEQPWADRVIDGTRVANDILATTAERASAFAGRTGSRPTLAAVLVGDDPASVTYVKMKRARCERVGVESRLVHLSDSASTVEIVDTIVQLSDDPTTHGILLQHPVPSQVDERVAFEAITPAKDVDGVTMHSFAAMAFGLPVWPRAHQPASSGCSMPTASPSKGDMQLSLDVARFSGSRSACCCSLATPP